jgi:hypothetical protein
MARRMLMEAAPLKKSWQSLSLWSGVDLEDMKDVKVSFYVGAGNEDFSLSDSLHAQCGLAANPKQELSRNSSAKREGSQEIQQDTFPDSIPR